MGKVNIVLLAQVGADTLRELLLEVAVQKLSALSYSQLSPRL
jgi:hypothetical protein